MVATRLIAVHINKGKTAARSLADRLDYSHNLVLVYKCGQKKLNHL